MSPAKFLTSTPQYRGKCVNHEANAHISLSYMYMYSTLVTYIIDANEMSPARARTQTFRLNIPARANQRAIHQSFPYSFSAGHNIDTDFSQSPKQF